MSGLGRRLAGPLLLAAFGTLLAFAALETGVRMLRLIPDRFWEPHPIIGTRLIAGKSGWWTRDDLEFRVPVTVNSHGWRDVERPIAKPPGVCRVLILGDSFIEAMQVPLDRTIARRLEELLNERPGGCSFEVVSMGVSGFGTAAQLLTYRTFGRAYDPDVVVLAFYPGNDVRNNSPTMEQVVQPVYDESGDVVRMIGATTERRVPESLPARWLGRSHAYRYTRKVILRRSPRLRSWLHGAGWVDAQAIREVPTDGGIPVEYGVYRAGAGPVWDDAWRRTESLLSRLADETAADGARFLVMLVTARERVYPDTWHEIVEQYPAMREHAWDLDLPEHRVLEWCIREDAACVPLTEHFLHRRDTGNELLHYLRDGHWTAAGHGLAAEVLAAAIRAQAGEPREMQP